MKQVPKPRVNTNLRCIGLIALVILVWMALNTLLLLFVRFPRIHRKHDQHARATRDIAALSGLVQHYYVDTEQYPTSLQDLRVCPNGVKNWRGPYTTKNIPPDPWGHEYIYQCPGPNGSDYIIISYGPTGVPGGTGDDAEISSED
jgi:general secretion pathway protein G